MPPRQCRIDIIRIPTRLELKLMTRLATGKKIPSQLFSGDIRDSPLGVRDKGVPAGLKPFFESREREQPH